MSEETAIYRYYGGPDCPDRYADPLAVRRKLRILLGGDGTQVLEACNSPDPQTALEGWHRLLMAIAYAFEVPTFDPATGQGLREEELLGLWNGFQDWLKKKQTSTASSPTSAPPTDSGLQPVTLPPKPTSGSVSTQPLSTASKRGRW
jgi:hypothetical protein